MRGIRLITADPANPKYKQKDLSSSPPTTGNCKTRNNSSSTYELRDLWITTGPLYPDLPDQESGSIYIETNTPSGALPRMHTGNEASLWLLLILSRGRLVYYYDRDC